MSKDKGEATVRQQDGHNHGKIQSHTCQVGNPQLENNNAKEVFSLL